MSSKLEVSIHAQLWSEYGDTKSKTPPQDKRGAEMITHHSHTDRHKFRQSRISPSSNWPRNRLLLALPSSDSNSLCRSLSRFAANANRS